MLAGRVSADPEAAREAGVTRAYGLVDHLGGDVVRAMAEPAVGLASLAAAVARTSSPRTSGPRTSGPRTRG